MTVVVLVFRFLHLLGFASVFGGLFTQIKQSEKQVNAAMLHGALTQVVTGIVLFVLELSEIDHMQIGIKFVLLIGLLVLFVVNRKRTLSSLAYLTSLGLVVVITAVAVFWGGAAS
jgi:hypothetical protein